MNNNAFALLAGRIALAFVQAVDDKTNRHLAEVQVTPQVVSKWNSDTESIGSDIAFILSQYEQSTRAVVRFMAEVPAEKEGEAPTYKLLQYGTMNRELGQGWKYKLLGDFSEDTDAVDVNHEDLPTYGVQMWKVVKDGNTLRRESLTRDGAFPYDGTLSSAEVIEHVLAQMGKRKMTGKTVDLECEIYYADTLIAKGSLSGGVERVASMEDAQDMSELMDELTTVRHRKSVMALTSGLSMREYVLDSTGRQMTPDVMDGLKQEGVYIKTDSLVVGYVKQYHLGKEVGQVKKFISRADHEMHGVLSNFNEDFVRVYISKELMAEMADKPENYVETLKWVKERMAKTKFPYFIIGAKKTLIFSRVPFGDTQITRDFMRVNLNRGEHLAQLIKARGVPATGSMKMPAIHNLRVPDGVLFAVNAKQGAKLGLPTGGHQMRMIEPYGKGIAIVMDEIAVPFFNEDAIKVKPEEVNGVTNWPDTIYGKNIIVISDNSSAYSMKISHQLGYVLVENFLKAKGKIKPWGNIGRYIARNISHETVKKTLSTEYSALQALGLPYAHFHKPEGIEDVLVSAARFEVAKLHLFAALPIQFLDRNYFDKVGVYCAPSDEDEQGRYWMRIPALAVGGAVQDLYHKDAKGKRILADKSSPLENMIIAAIYEPTVIGKDGDDEDILQFEDDVEIGGDGRSRIIWNMMNAMGADSDGDRVGRTYKLAPGGVPVDKVLEDAGLKCDMDVPLLKSKNPYPNIKDWENEEHREQLWAQSTPRLRNVGMGDVMTQDCCDLVMEGHMNLEVWKKQAIAGANIVQTGVSAPKYYMPIIYKPVLKTFEVSAKVRATGIGRGYQNRGLMYAEAHKKLEGILGEFFPVEADYQGLPITHKARKWEGGFSSFLQKIAMFDESMGDIWVTYVKDAFKQELARMMTGHITDTETRRKELRKFGKNFQEGHARKIVRGYIAAFIQQFPEKTNIWAWLLTTEFVRPMPSDRRPDGMELTAPYLTEGEGQILEVMGLPFNIEALREKEVKLQKAKERARDNKAMRK